MREIQMLVRRILVVVGLFDCVIVRTIGPIHSVSVTFFHYYRHDTNLLLIIRPYFEATAFNLICTCKECVVEEICYSFLMNPNITKPS